MFTAVPVVWPTPSFTSTLYRDCFSPELSAILTESDVCAVVRQFLSDANLVTVEKFFYAIDSLETVSQDLLQPSGALTQEGPVLAKSKAAARHAYALCKVV